jgi:hypothetical protein
MGSLGGHAGGKVDIEVFDGEFAGDQAGEEAISQFLEVVIHLIKSGNLFKYGVYYSIKLFLN